MSKVIGIDLGTTNSCVAIMEGSEPRVVENSEGGRTTPSIVAFTEDGERLVGQAAKRQAVTNPENTIFAIKRLIGRAFKDPMTQKDINMVPYSIIDDGNADAWVSARGETYSPSQISAFILQKMKETVESNLGETITQAVITVPAYFNDLQRQATKDAGQIAGLDVIRIINEPTAGALAYGFGKNIDRTVAVYDLGGGTFDISILEISSAGVFKVVSTAGDTFLGGEDFDQRIIDWLVQGFREEHDIDLRQDRMALQRLKDAAEKAKCELSAVMETEVNLPFIISSPRNEALHLQQLLTRAQLEELTQDLVERTVQICEMTLDEAGLEKDEIEDVVLVGGMTRMPRVQQAVSEFFEREPCKGVHPDEVVGLGASIQGAALVDDSKELDMVLLDVTPHTLGIMVAGGFFEELIQQNSTVPTSDSKPFTTVRDNQTAVKILVLQGESKKADENELLGEFILTGLRRAPAGQIEVDVTFEINADGIVSVHAKDTETGKEQSITVTATSGLTQDEIDLMMQEASEYAVARRGDEESEGVKQQAETLIAEIQKLFPEVEAVVAGSDFGRDAIEKARAVVDRARMLMDRNDSAGLKEQIDALTRTQRMFKGVVGKSA